MPKFNPKSRRQRSPSSPSSSPSKFGGGKLIAIIGGAALLAVTAGLFVTNSAANSSVMSGGRSTTPNSKQNLSREQILAEITSPTIPAAPVLGSRNATVTLVEFGDYQCTYCHRFHVDTKNAVLSNYVATGKVRFVFKDFPINDLSDKASTLAAAASYCAADQGMYWQYHDTLYNNWQGENTGWVTRASLQQFATSIGLNQTSFTSCLNSGKYDSVVKSNYDTALALGLNATPSFIIVGPNGNPSLISGAYPYATYQQALDKALA